jgi:hypothetical protein
LRRCGAFVEERRVVAGDEGTPGVLMSVRVPGRNDGCGQDEGADALPSIE